MLNLKKIIVIIFYILLFLLLFYIFIFIPLQILTWISKHLRKHLQLRKVFKALSVRPLVRSSVCCNKLVSQF